MTKLTSNFSAFGKYLDQPALVKHFNNKIPIALITSASAYCLYDTYQSPKEKQKKTFIKDLSTLSFTVASAILATRGIKIGGKQIFEGLVELPHLHQEEIKEVLTNSKYKISYKAKDLINKVTPKNKLSFSEIKTLKSELESQNPNIKLIDKTIPPSHSHSPFEELAKLSLLGLIPVIGGIAGGILGDKLTGEHWRKKLPNKIKEGAYQYLNNIFLCNVGAGLGMLLMNKLNVKNKAIRFSAMLTGVVGVGLVAGSAIANFISKNMINPIFTKKAPDKSSMFKDLNKERHPELLDLGLHIDDIASVGFLSGMKLIGPILPLLYSISGYRAGIGYRNGDCNCHKNTLNRLGE